MMADVDFDQDRRQCRFDILFGALMMDLDVDSPEVQYIFQQVLEKGAIVDSTLVAWLDSCRTLSLLPLITLPNHLNATKAVTVGARNRENTR